MIAVTTHTVRITLLTILKLRFDFFFFITLYTLDYNSVAIIIKTGYKMDAYIFWFLGFNSAEALWRRCAKPEAHFSICWCRLLTTNLLTCTGMGTTIFPAPPTEHFDRPRVPFPAKLLILFPSWHAVVDNRLAFTRFHFARRFWNHIFTCKT